MNSVNKNGKLPSQSSKCTWLDVDWEGDEHAGAANVLTWILATDLFTATLCAASLADSLGSDAAALSAVIKVAKNIELTGIEPTADSAMDSFSLAAKIGGGK